MHPDSKKQRFRAALFLMPMIGRVRGKHNPEINRLLMRIILISIAILLSPTSYAADSKGEMKKEIMHLFDYLKNSDCEFNRNGKWYNAKEAEKHLKNKYKNLFKKGLINSTEQFIELSASKSSMSGKPYMVKCDESKPMKSSVWFKKELASFRKKTSSNR